MCPFISRSILILFSLSLLLFFACSGQDKEDPKKNAEVEGPILLIHGGAGNIQKDGFPEDRRQKYRNSLQNALDSGYAVLKSGASAVDAVEAAIVEMEDDSLFNAGRGSVYTHDEKNEMDASIMRGRDKNAGSMAGVGIVKNPIRGAREVMTGSKHVMLAREGAEAFAIKQGLDTVDPSYFRTERRLDALRRRKDKKEGSGSSENDTSADKHGTVGAVALDREGHLAAGTSTGGMMNKKFARIGDSPIIGAGTYADDRTCAVSATGHGEYFMRNLVTHDIASRMDYLDESVEEAARTVIMEKLEELGGSGGVIALGASGDRAVVFNTKGMFRGMKGPEKEWVRFFGKE